MYSSIDKNTKYYSVAAQCKALEISRNSFYNWKKEYKDKLKKRAKLLIAILRIYWDSDGIYGAPRITIELKKSVY